ncbi:MAG: hypothetical protein NWR32_11565 [Cypionkella sp.]|nr:hypothetical protein [Cypionkella sp.]
MQTIARHRRDGGAKNRAIGHIKLHIIQNRRAHQQHNLATRRVGQDPQPQPMRGRRITKLEGLRAGRVKRLRGVLYAQGHAIVTHHRDADNSLGGLCPCQLRQSKQKRNQQRVKARAEPGFVNALHG